MTDDTDTDTDNVVSINENNSPLGLILRRQQFIKARYDQIRQQQSALSDEYNALIKEDRGLDVAAKAVKDLLERGS